MSQFIEMFGDPVSWQTDTSLPTLNDTVNVISGFPFDSEKFDTEGVGTPLIRIRDIQRGYSETFTTEAFDEQYRIKKYELLVGMDGMFDIARWQSDEAALNQRVCCLRMKGSENDTFIQYLVQPILKHIEKGTNATTVKHISTKQINGIRVPIASHEQKNKFAMFANQADKSGFDGRKSQFIEMFGNPVTNNKGWNTLPIKDVAPETSSLEKQTGKVWILNLDMIESNTGKVVEKVFENDSNLLSVAPFDEGNVLYSKLRPYLNKVVIPDGKGYATTELVPLRPNQKLLNLTFFSHLLRGDDFVTYANSISTGTKMPRMPLNDLRKFQCILPPMEKQNEFEEIAHQADKSGSVLLKLSSPLTK